MKQRTWAFLIVLFASAAVIQADPRLALRRKFADTEGCAVSTLSCDGTPQEGTIATGDCTVTDGTRYDQWQVFANAGDELTVELQALDTTLTDPFIDLEPPDGDTTAVTPLVISGGTTARIKYILTTTGNWTLNVGSNDVTGSGRYRLRAFCNTSTSTDAQNCEPQPMTCNELWIWDTTPASCTFTNTPAVYAPFDIYLAAGDVLNIDMISNDFDPAVAVYPQGGNGNAVASAFGLAGLFDAALGYKVGTSGLYQIVAWDGTSGGYGQFAIQVGCTSTCSPPAIVSHPASQTSQGGAVALSVTALGASPFTYQWYQGKAGDTSHPVSTDASLQVPSPSASAAYWVRVTNTCGSADSNTAFVNVVTPGKHRVAGHT